MSEWKKVKFLDVISLNPRISLEKGVEYPFVEMSNAVPGARRPEKDVYQKYSGGGAKFEEGDTVVARIEPCLQNGKGFQCSYKKGFGSTEFLVFRPMNIKEMDYNFLYYYMGQQSIREAMAKTMVGASGRQRVNNAVFNDLQIHLPPLSIQQDIATILSRYDSLIENYQKQIKLLEEAAQRLYKEWFLDLHFPGHENTKIVDGVPEGWEKKKVKEVCDTTSGGTPSRSKTEFYTGDILWVKTKELNDDFIFDTEEKITEDAIRNSSAKMVPSGSILMAMYGATIGKLGIATKELSCNQACCVFLLPEDSTLRLYLYNWLLNSRTLLISMGKGAAQPNLSQDMIKNLEIVVPSSCLLAKFDSKVKPLYRIMSYHSSQIRLLTEARDRLLPKLMSGDIEI
jgi:type I restriction enzyme S subunit